MTQIPEIELKDILLSNSSFGPNEIAIISNRICNDFSQFPNLRDVTDQMGSRLERTPAESVRLGVCQYMLGRYSSAISTLENSDGGALAYFYQGKSHFSLGAYDRAIASYESRKKLATTPINACWPSPKPNVWPKTWMEQWRFWTICLVQSSKPRSTCTSGGRRLP